MTLVGVFFIALAGVAVKLTAFVNKPKLARSFRHEKGKWRRVLQAAFQYAISQYLLF